MDIHKPKPVHSLREFLSEIGVVVCGILIAIGLDQAVEAFHWSERVEEAKTSIHHELGYAVVFSQERLAFIDCASARLDAVAAAVVASPPQWAPPDLNFCGFRRKGVYVSLWRPWPTEVWRSIEAEGVVSHFGKRYRLDAPFTFTFINELGQLNRQERDLANDLQPLAYPVTLTPELRVEFLRTIAALQAVNRQMAVYARDLDGTIKDLGETPTDAELKVWRTEVPNLWVRPGVILNIPPEPQVSR